MRQTQIETLKFIYDYQNEKGWAPSFREIGTGLHLSSTNSVYHRIAGLELDGYVTREKGKSRAISITDMGYRELNTAGVL